jgi:sigma-B regulation protein RsbU (phosphoserine phosphatase)
MVIADVSGKGIPAALFMVMTKMLVKVNTLTGSGPAEVLETVNNQICTNNLEEMFVTVWLGILDLKTGVLTASNAGHEYPMLMNPDGQFEYYKDKHGFVIGGMPDMMYKDYEIRMQKGSKLYIYTDGLPEAQNSKSEFLGSEASLGYVNKYADRDPQQLIEGVCREVGVFSDGASRFDDMTMLCIEYSGNTTEGD